MNKTRTFHRLRLATLLVLAGLPILCQGDESGAVAPSDRNPLITTAQIEADWRRQAFVRSLPSIGTQITITTQPDAAGACDGVIEGPFGFGTGLDENAWWQVDLGQLQPLDRIVTYNRGDFGGERAARLKVLVSEDGQQWQQIYEHDGSVFLGRADQKPLQVAANDCQARYVRIQLPGANYLHLEEVEVYRGGSSENQVGQHLYPNCGCIEVARQVHFAMKL